jgi:hypothetical protein
MNRIASILVGALLALSGCQSPQPPADQRVTSTPYSLPANDVEVVKRFVAAKLKDPASATFGSMAAAVDAKGVVSVCGSVNARNSFGGYTGHRPYSGILATNMRGERVFAVVGIGDTDTQAVAIFRLCQRDGIV